MVLVASGVASHTCALGFSWEREMCLLSSKVQ